MTLNITKISDRYNKTAESYDQIEYDRWEDFVEDFKTYKNIDLEKDSIYEPDSVFISRIKPKLGIWLAATLEGGKRDENVQSLSMLVLDYDKGETSIGAAFDFWTTAYASQNNLTNCLLHHSVSSSDQCEKFRVVIPFSRDVSPAEYAIIWQDAANKAKTANHVLDLSAKNPARLWIQPYAQQKRDPIKTFIDNASSINVDLILADSGFDVNERPKVQSVSSNAISRLYDNVRNCAEGNRNNTLFHSSARAGAYIKGGSLDEDDAREQLLAAGMDAGEERSKCISTINSGITRGKAGTALILREEIKSTPLLAYEEGPITWQWTNATDFPSVDWVCRDLGVAAGAVTILCGFINSGKTFVAADLAICVANNLQLFDAVEVQATGAAVHIDFEAGEQMSKIYYQRLLNGHGIETFENIKFWKPRWRLDQPEAEQQLMKHLVDVKLCVIDCFSAGVPTTEQNSESARAPIDMLNRVSEHTRCAIVLLHHEPKVKGTDPLRSVKGSGSIIAAAGNSLHVIREPGSTEATILRGKKRMGKDFSITFCKEDIGEHNDNINDTVAAKLVNTGKKSSTEVLIPNEILKLIAMSPGINSSAIEYQIKSKIIGGKRQADIVNEVRELVTAGLIDKVKEGKSNRFTLTDKGRSVVSYEIECD